MAEKKLKKEEDHGKVLLEWSFPEYSQEKKSRSWYVIAIIIFVIALFYSFISANFLFTVFLVLFGLIMFLNFKRTPLEVKFKIFEDGLMLGSRFYEWSEIKNFRLVYRPPEIKKLYFDLKKDLAQEIPVSLEDQGPIEVREILQEYLEEDLERREETLFDHLNRWLKI